jgi:uncharacterized repeat protein (TIGR03803 family)
VTPSGGTSTNGLGTVFKLERTTNGWRERIVHNFTGAPDGAQPSAGLVSNSQGHLFGTTPYGGGTACPNGCGTVYEITP